MAQLVYGSDTVTTQTFTMAQLVYGSDTVTTQTFTMAQLVYGSDTVTTWTFASVLGCYAPVPVCGRFNYLDISLRSQGCWKGTATGCVFSLKVKLQVVFSLKIKPQVVFSL